MNIEENIELQLDSAQWACKKADELMAKLKRARTNKERSKIITQLESIRGRLLMESHFIDKLVEDCIGPDEDYDRGF